MPQIKADRRFLPAELLPPVLLCSALVLACSGGPFDLLGRTADEPKVVSPAVDSLGREGKVLVSWAPEAAADGYRLYRDSLPDGSGRLLVYEGSSTAVADAVPAMDTLFYYRLAKIRGSREFGPSDPVPGVASSVARDSQMNDERSSATPVNYVTQATIFYYRDAWGNEIEDRDWYLMQVPPRSFVTVAVTNLSNTDLGELYFQVENQTAQLLSTTGGERKLFNFDLEARPVYFQIYVAKDAFVGELSAPGGKIAAYQIEYRQTNAI